MNTDTAEQHDLFDNGSDSQPGERQTDIELIIKERSLAQAIIDGDTALESALVARSKAGEVIRIM